MNMLDKAFIVAECFHNGQVDKGGVNYINHPIWVSNHCKGKNAKIVALLHDIIEATSCTYEILRNLGFSKKIIRSLTAITHIKSMSYDKYIDICMTDRIARQVKFWDMIHNSDLTRIQNPTQKDFNNMNKYIHFAFILANTRKQHNIVENCSEDSLEHYYKSK